MSHQIVDGEIRLPLPNGGFLCCGMGAVYENGSELKIRDAEGHEILHWECTEWQEDPELVIGAVFGAAIKSLAELTKDRKLVGGIWVQQSPTIGGLPLAMVAVYREIVTTQSSLWDLHQRLEKLAGRELPGLQEAVDHMCSVVSDGDDLVADDFAKMHAMAEQRT